MAKDKCVLCDAETPYDESVHIDYRHGYIEGAGQLCKACYDRGTEYTHTAIPNHLIRNTPNDQELGSKVRQIYYQSSDSGSYSDLETYRTGRSKH